jgi:uncharacterized membrane protein
MDAVSVRLGHVAPVLFLWPLLYTVAIGSGTFMARHMSWVATMDNNKVKLDDSVQMILWIAATLLALGVFYAVAVPVARWVSSRRPQPGTPVTMGASPPNPRDGRLAAGTVLAELHGRMRPLLALPLLEALTFAAIERDSPKETLFLVALAGIVAGAAAYVWLRPLVARPPRERLALGGAALAVAALWTRLRPPDDPAFYASLTSGLMNLLHRTALQPAERSAFGRSALQLGFLAVLAALTGALAGAAVVGWLRDAARFGAGPLTASLPDDGPPPRRPGRERAAKVAAVLAIGALWAGYAFFFSRLSILNHHGLRTATIDLGYYDNIFYQSAHGRPLGCSFIKMGYHGSAHFDPILVVLSPLYLLYPRAEFLLVLQSVWLGMGVVPVYLLGRGRLQSRASGVALAAMYAVYPALHGANMYEFHSLTLVAPVALWQLYFLEAGHRRAYWALLLPTLLVREDVAILMCFVGGYAVLSRRPGWARLGWVTILVSIIYFAVVKRFFMTSVDVFMSGPNSYSFAYYYDDLIPNHNGVAGMLISLLTNPVFVLKTMLAEAKVVYVLTLFVPLCFLPLVARPGRFMLAWGMIFCLLATRPAVFSTHFQYSCIIIPVAFALVPEALRQVEDGPFARAYGLDGVRFRQALLAGAFVASLLTSWKFGGVIDNGSFHGGFGPPARSLSDKDRETYAWIEREVAKIPRDASVGTTNRAGAYVSNRKAAYFYPEHTDVDWLFLDDSEIRGADQERLAKSVKAGVFELIGKHDRFALYQRKKAD